MAVYALFDLRQVYALVFTDQKGEWVPAQARRDPSSKVYMLASVYGSSWTVLRLACWILTCLILCFPGRLALSEVSVISLSASPYKGLS